MSPRPPGPRWPWPKKLLPTVVSALMALVLIPAASGAATSGGETPGREMPGGKMKGRSAIEAAETARAQGIAQSDRGDRLVLTPRQADAWRGRPVVAHNGRLIGHVAAVTLDADGRIAGISVQPSELPDGDLRDSSGAFAVQPDRFAVGAGRVMLAMTGAEVEDKVTR